MLEGSTFSCEGTIGSSSLAAPNIFLPWFDGKAIFSRTKPKSVYVSLSAGDWKAEINFGDCAGDLSWREVILLFVFLNFQY